MTEQINLLEVSLDSGFVDTKHLIRETENFFIYSICEDEYRSSKKPSHDGNYWKVRSDDKEGQLLILNELSNRIKKLEEVKSKIQQEFKKY